MMVIFWRSIILATTAFMVSLTLAKDGMAMDHLSSPAHEQSRPLYRSNRAPVLTPSPVSATNTLSQELPPKPLIREAFRTAYQRAGSPRLAVFWNRTFSDQLSDMVVDKRRVIDKSKSVDKSKSKSGAKDIKIMSESPPAGTQKGDAKYEKNEEIEISKQLTGRTQTTIERRVEQGSGDSMIPKESLYPFTASYLQPLIEEGAVLIDRDTIMRLTSGRPG